MGICMLWSCWELRGKVVSPLSVAKDDDPVAEPPSSLRPLRNLKKLCELGVLGGDDLSNTGEGDHLEMISAFNASDLPSTV